jgi:hypothetical protein
MEAAQSTLRSIVAVSEPVVAAAVGLEFVRVGLEEWRGTVHTLLPLVAPSPAPPAIAPGLVPAPAGTVAAGTILSPGCRRSAELEPGELQVESESS